MVTQPSTAIVELVANCRDACTTEVELSWPGPKAHQQFSVSDKGKGMTRAGFDYRRCFASFSICHSPFDMNI
ncbi:MAG: ATP-binding protein [Janthinobacterium lividum]